MKDHSIYVDQDRYATSIVARYALRLLKSMYGMNNSGKLFADELTEWLIEAGFIQSQYKMKQMFLFYMVHTYNR